MLKNKNYEPQIAACENSPRHENMRHEELMKPNRGTMEQKSERGCACIMRTGIIIASLAIILLSSVHAYQRAYLEIQQPMRIRTSGVTDVLREGKTKEPRGDDLKLISEISEQTVSKSSLSSVVSTFSNLSQAQPSNTSTPNPASESLPLQATSTYTARDGMNESSHVGHRRKPWHRSVPDAQEFQRLVSLPVTNHTERMDNLNKALEACYNCKPDLRTVAKIADRRLLVDKYFPVLSSSRVRAVLFVGLLDTYAAQAEHYFRAKNPDVVFVTLERMKDAAIWGAYYYGKELSYNIVDIVENVNNHAHPLFDVVFMHGVIGWGLDGVQAVNNTAVALHRCVDCG
jgi:hypothetical protein